MVKRRIQSVTHLKLEIIYELFFYKKGMTIKKLSENIKTDYKNTYNAVDFLSKEGIIKKEKIGNYNLCTLNYENEEIIHYLNWYNFGIRIKEFKKKHNTESQIITETINELKNVMTPFFICLVFGSYAKNEEKTDSDVDILFLTHGKESGHGLPKKILTKNNAPYQKKFHIIEQNIRDFSKDLENKGKLSIASELYKELPLVFYGTDTFFRMIIEANN